MIEPADGHVQAPDAAATALRDAARLLDMVADARDVYLEGMDEDSEPAIAIQTFGSGIRSAARILRAEPHTVELLVPTWRYLDELAELDLKVRALAAGAVPDTGSGDERPTCDPSGTYARIAAAAAERTAQRITIDSLAWYCDSCGALRSAPNGAIVTTACACGSSLMTGRGIGRALLGTDTTPEAGQ